MKNCHLCSGQTQTPNRFLQYNSCDFSKIHKHIIHSVTKQKGSICILLLFVGGGHSSLRFLSRFPERCFRIHDIIILFDWGNRSMFQYGTARGICSQYFELTIRNVALRDDQPGESIWDNTLRHTEEQCR